DPVCIQNRFVAKAGTSLAIKASCPFESRCDSIGLPSVSTTWSPCTEHSGDSVTKSVRLQEEVFKTSMSAGTGAFWTSAESVSDWWLLVRAEVAVAEPGSGHAGGSAAPAFPSSCLDCRSASTAKPRLTFH